MEMYVDGNYLRRIARHLKVAPETAAYWVTDVAEALPNPPLPSEVNEAEMYNCSPSLATKKTKSTFLRWQIAQPVVFWAGRWSGSAPRQRYNTLWIRLRKPKGITPMPSIPIKGSGITTEGTRFRKASPIPIRSKRTMPNCVTIWHVRLASPAVFLVVPILSYVPYVCLSFVSTAGNSTKHVILITLQTLWTSLAHYISHSQGYQE